MTPELSQKITSYIRDNGLTFTPRAEVLSKMVAEGVITQAEYEEVINGNIYALTTDSETEVGDVVTITSAPSSDTPTAQPSLRKPHHPLFRELELDRDGKIDMEQFSLDAIKAKYNSDEYEVTEEDIEGTNTITVTNKASGATVYAVMMVEDEYGETEYLVSYFNRSGVADKALTIRNKIIESLVEYNEDESYTATTYEDGDVTKVDAKTHTRPDGSYTITTYENSQISMVAEYSSDDEFVSAERYVGGKPYAQCDEQENILKNYIIEELFKDLQDPSGIDKFINDIKTKINEQNIKDIVNDYFKEFDQPITELIRNALKLTQEQKADLLQYLYSLMSKAEGVEGAAQNLKNNIAMCYEFDIAEELKNNILETDPSNILTIATAFGGYSFESPVDMPVSKRSQLSLIDIINDAQLSDEDKNICKKHIVDNLIAYAETNNIYCKDIKEDINAHMDNPSLFNIDYRRLISRLNSIQHTEPVSEPNGDFDVDYTQGGTGDCWLISGIKAILNREGGKDVLKSLLTVDKENRTITVKFPNVDKAYVISFDEISQSTHLATGDGDIRALEIAVDRYKKDLAYESAADDEMISFGDDEYDINGDSTQVFFDLVYGGCELLDDEDMTTWKPEDTKTPMIFALNDDGDKVSAMDETTKEVFLLDVNHAYILDSVDDDYIYLVDPRKNGYNKMRVLRSELEGISTGIEIGRKV
ncbi:MAG: hypothetical protein K6E29_08495 [Cyanobacteria bacterium RUI128]|nr:hypothetical protein [Cyanobacteria bacterium RUI128]